MTFLSPEINLNHLPTTQDLIDLKKPAIEQVVNKETKLNTKPNIGKFNFQSYRQNFNRAPEINEEEMNINHGSDYNKVNKEKVNFNPAIRGSKHTDNKSMSYSQQPELKNLSVFNDKIIVDFPEDVSPKDKKYITESVTETLNERFSPYYSFAYNLKSNKYSITFLDKNFKNTKIDPYFEIALGLEVEKIMNREVGEEISKLSKQKNKVSFFKKQWNRINSLLSKKR